MDGSDPSMHSRQALAPNQMIRTRKRKFHKSSFVILNRDCDGKKTRERPRSSDHGVETRTRTSFDECSSLLFLLLTTQPPPSNSEHVGRLEVASDDGMGDKGRKGSPGVSF